MGTLCVADQTPRKHTPAQMDALQTLAQQVSTLLEYRRVAAELAAALSKVKTMSRLFPVCAWGKQVRHDTEYWSEVEQFLANEGGLLLSHGVWEKCCEREVAPDK